jgi:F-type H+-transporting ATPase subunit delta
LTGALATRYAQALVDVALERKDEARVKDALDAFAELFASSAALLNCLETPAVDRQAKQKVIAEIATRMDLAPEVRNLLLVLVDHRRTRSLPEIQRAFAEQLNARLRIAEADVVSASELGAKEKQDLAKALAGRIHVDEVEARFAVDESLLGGVVVRTGSTIFDGSVRLQLNRLRERLAAE